MVAISGVLQRSFPDPELLLGEAETCLHANRGSQEVEGNLEAELHYTMFAPRVIVSWQS